MKRLKYDGDLYRRIIDAENALFELGIFITYSSASDGIIIRDRETGMEFRTIDTEYEFPRSTETEFILLNESTED
jgi:hypothetical protein